MRVPPSYYKPGGRGAGARWLTEIHHALALARVVLRLVSPPFLASGLSTKMS